MVPDIEVFRTSRSKSTRSELSQNLSHEASPEDILFEEELTITCRGQIMNQNYPLFQIYELRDKSVRREGIAVAEHRIRCGICRDRPGMLGKRGLGARTNLTRHQPMHPGHGSVIEPTPARWIGGGVS